MVWHHSTMYGVHVQCTIDLPGSYGTIELSAKGHAGFSPSFRAFVISIREVNAMARAGLDAVALRKPDKVELERFRGLLAYHLGRTVTLSEAVRLAVRATIGEAERVARDATAQEADNSDAPNGAVALNVL